MNIFGRKEEKSAVELKREAVIQNVSQLLSDRINTMSDVYGKDVLIAWLDAVEAKYFENAQDAKIVDAAHTTARTCNVW